MIKLLITVRYLMGRGNNKSTCNARMQMKFDLLQRDRSGPRVVTTSEFKENECEN